METALIAAAAAFASLLTFFSGFGLGTLPLPVFLLFFPVDMAIALTAIVHFLNNIFKTGLIGRHISSEVLLKFGLPALVFAVLGAWLLGVLSTISSTWAYDIFGMHVTLSPVKVIIGLLLIAFAVAEFLPGKINARRSDRTLYLGGTLSGFFGGLSGHQGALRTVFLLRYGLTKNVFIATGIGISLLVDVSRLAVYWSSLDAKAITSHIFPLSIAILSAFAGAYIGRRLLRKVTLRFIQIFIGILIGIVGVLLLIGVL
jgi:uncharacterized membrane protein YfcA